MTQDKLYRDLMKKAGEIKDPLERAYAEAGVRVGKALKEYYEETNKIMEYILKNEGFVKEGPDKHGRYKWKKSGKSRTGG